MSGFIFFEKSFEKYTGPYIIAQTHRRNANAAAAACMCRSLPGAKSAPTGLI